jgi:hypothetical protein
MSWENRGQAEGVLFGRYPLESAIRKSKRVDAKRQREQRYKEDQKFFSAFLRDSLRSSFNFAQDMSAYFRVTIFEEVSFA